MPTPAGARTRRPRVSLAMIVRDEEAHLPGCLEGCAGAVDEIVVVDTGSVDRTREIALSYGAKVYDFPWCDDFSAARNESLRRATGDWIFWMDADDRLDETNRERLAELFEGLAGERWLVSFDVHCPDSPDGSRGNLVRQWRLFRHLPELHWQGRIHEDLVPPIEQLGGTTRHAPIKVEHLGYLDAAGRPRRIERNLRLLRLQLADLPNDPRTLFYLGHTLWCDGRAAEAVPVLEQCRQIARPGAWYLPALYAALVECLLKLGKSGQARGVCLAALVACPTDATLLRLHSQLVQPDGRAWGGTVVVDGGGGS